MEKIKKIFKFLLFGILFLIIFLIIRLIIVTNYYGYEESKIMFKPNKLYPFNDTIIKQLQMKSRYSNNQNDTISIYNYKNEYQILFMSLEEYKNIKAVDITESEQVNLKREDLIIYSKIVASEEPFLEIQTKAKLPNIQKLYLYFSKKRLIKKKECTKDYLYYYLNCYEIGLNSEKNYFDVRINRGSSFDANLLIFNSKCKFCLILMYSTHNNIIDSDLLYSLININNL